MKDEKQESKEEKKKPSFTKEGKVREDKKFAEKKVEKKEVMTEMLIRIKDTDIPAEKSVYIGLIRIKGISWGISNAICHILGIDRHTKIKELGKEQIDKINHFDFSKLKHFMMNRRKDYEDGKDKHLLTSSLDLQKELDIKRLQKIKSRRGLRHAWGLPLRGQKTRHHFRKGSALGVKKKLLQQQAAAAGKEAKGEKKK